MPTLPMMTLSPPRDFAEFEHMVRAYCRKTFPSALGIDNTDIFGRPGQKQYGIDLLVTLQDQDTIVVQCKDYKKTAVTAKSIDLWIATVDEKSLQFHFRELIIAVAKDRDANIQNYVAGLSQDRALKNKFPITILFWDSIEDFIKNDPKLRHDYYPAVFPDDPSQEKHNIVNGVDNASAKLSTQGSQKVNLIENANTAIRSEIKLKNAFIDIVVQYHIQDFLREDPFVGIKMDLVEECDSFLMDARRLIDRSIALRDTDAYAYAANLSQNISDLTTYYGQICQVPNGEIAIVNNPFEREKQTEHEKWIQMVKDAANQNLYELTWS